MRAIFGIAIALLLVYIVVTILHTIAAIPAKNFGQNVNTQDDAENMPPGPASVSQ